MTVKTDFPTYHDFVGSNCIEQYDFQVHKTVPTSGINSAQKLFKKDDYLLVRRSLYGSDFRERAPRANFDGVCSADILTIREKNEIIADGFLIYVLYSQDLWNFIISKSTGSLTRRIKWKQLAEYEFLLPPYEIQQSIASRLWAAYRLKEGYKKLLDATDEMVKSQFIEMFGNPFINDKRWNEYGCLYNYSEIILGSTPDTNIKKYWDGGLKWVTPAEMSDETFYLYDTERHISELGARSAGLKLMPIGTVLMSTRAPIGKIGIVGSPMYCNQGFKNFICNLSLNSVFLYYSLKLNKDYLCSLGTGTTFKELSKNVVMSLKISVPPMLLQREFERIYVQADKSKFELKQCIENIDKVIRSLING